MADNRWILVADNGRARFFADHGSSSDLEEVQDLVHPEARLPGRDLTTDASGRRSGSDMSHKRAEEEMRSFAKTVAGQALKDLQGKKFDDLVIIAPPRFLGALKKQLDGRLTKAVSATLTKDLCNLSPHDLTGALRKEGLWNFPL